MARRPKKKRGAVLLVVLTLLTLLIVVALTFTLIAGLYRRSAEAASTRERFGDDPRDVLDRAMYQLARDVRPTARSAMKGHSLLGDLHGTDGAVGQITSLAEGVGGEFLGFDFTPIDPFSVQPGYYNGCTVTFLDFVYTPGADGGWGVGGVDDDGNGTTDDVREAGWAGSDDIAVSPHSSLSVRVLRYNPLNAGPPPQPYSMIVESPRSDTSTRVSPSIGGRFLVNGRPFNGKGAGYLNAAPYTLDQTVMVSGQPQQLSTALLPNYGHYPLPPPPPNPALGGLDEPWDAVDYQNMFLAMVPPDITQGLIPSFHRPELVNFWLNWVATNWLVPAGINAPAAQVQAFRFPFGLDFVPGNGDDPVPPALAQQIVALKRMVILRPLPEDHPNFGDAAGFIATMGLPDQVDGMGQPLGPQLAQMVWEVDNDSDGIPDSVWIDIGLPMQTDPTGRRYKPMVAFLCKDLDGRLNVNAQGSNLQRRDQYAYATTGLLSNSPMDAGGNLLNAPFAGGVPRNLPFLPRGHGYGPADIFLGHVFVPNSIDFFGVFNERYQDTVVNAAGISGVDDWQSLIKSLGVPLNYNGQYSSYGTHPDLWGRGAIGLDYAGHPIRFYQGEAGETVGDPYELVLNRKSAGNAGAPVDAPFTLAEMERLLRWHDMDAPSLPDRLMRTASNTVGTYTAAHQRNRALLTTHSSHLPVISGMVPEEYRAVLAGMNVHSILDLYAARLTTGGVPAAQLEAEMAKVVPWEIWHGQRMNVNRWFGNRRDDNGNNVVDEPLEADVGEVIWPDSTPDIPGGFDGGAPAVPFNYLNRLAAEPFEPIAMNRFASQIFARHLYCLMLVLTDVVGPTGYLHPTEEGLPLADRVELTAHRIAQYAINVVDFCDADAIMTPFEYDIDPFDGWQNNLDGDPATNPPVTPPAVNQRRLVWGVEYPDLLLSETIALHDRRVKDTADDSTGQTRDDSAAEDDDLDQYRIPQGSLYLELYCPRNQATNNTRFPRELYDVNGMLDLGRVSPGGMPVWRVMISEQPANPGDMPRIRAQRGGAGLPDSTSFNPVEAINPLTGVYDPTWSYNMNLLSQLQGTTPPAASDRLPAERFVWLAPVAPPLAGDGLRTYWCRNFAPGAGPLLAPGSYAVVGPREHTRIGSSDDGNLGTFYDPSPQRISLAGGAFQQWDNDGVDRYGPGVGVNYRPAVGIVCAAHPPVAPTAPAPWTNAALLARGIGLSVSEPLPNGGFYYPEPGYVYDPLDGLPDGFEEPDTTQRANRLPDAPFDNDPNRPLGADQSTGTRLDFKAAFLQRLANPLEPYHITRNPYITVDWATIDLTVFNGEDQWVASTPNANPWDPDDPDPQDPIHFSTRQRGLATLTTPAPIYGANIVLPANADYTLWSPTATPPVLTQVVPNPVMVGGVPMQHFFQHNISHTLGFLNGTMGPTLPPAIVAAAPNYLGSPQQPFPWLNWNDRPYANPMELMQVPCSTASRLLHEFDVFRPSFTTTDPYNSVPLTPPPAPSALPEILQFSGTFRHLLNFFHTSKAAPSTEKAPNFYRIFDHVETPSPFVGAEMWYNPVRTAVDPAAFSFRPPYNGLSRFQDPGRVNINTIFDRDIWVGISKGFPALDPDALGAAMFLRIFESRRGYPTAAGLFALNSNYPTLFGNPFRPADSADLMPNNVGAAGYELRKTEAVQASLLREEMHLPLPAVPRTDAVFVPDAAVVPSAILDHQNQNRNPFFRYQGLARLSNLVSYNSNYFAVWITLGYFEVEPNPVTVIAPTGVDIAHPDGFRLSRELGSDMGTVKRHRAFYIIDRSEPVGFSPGENLNVDRAIKLRRFIE